MSGGAESPAPLDDVTGEPPYEPAQEPEVAANSRVTDTDRAFHWQRTYSQLVDHKRRVLRSKYRLVEKAPGPLRHLILEGDIILLEVQLSRLEQKRDHWRLLALELAERRGAPA